MKKILLFAVCSLIATISYSQKVYAWWDVGAKLGYGLTGMLNNKDCLMAQKQECTLVCLMG